MQRENRGVGSQRQLARGGGALLTIGVVGVLALCVAGCATPVGYKRVGTQAVSRELGENIVISDALSPYSRQFLYRLALAQRFETDPQAVIGELHAGLGAPDQQPRLFALAELSYACARRTADRRYYLAAVVYAYAFLFPANSARAPSRYSQRARMALQLYDFGLAQGLSTEDGQWVDVRARTVELPFGTLVLTPDTTTFVSDDLQAESFVPLAEIDLRGLRNRYWRQGIGAPVGVRTKTIAGSVAAAATAWMPPNPEIPGTLVARFADLGAGFAARRVEGTIELYPFAEERRVRLGTYDIPLAVDSSGVLAFRLEGSPVWDTEIAGFRRGDFRLFAGQEEKHGLFMVEPFRPGRVPVVFVHGTASSHARWAQMANELMGDRLINAHYQFWFFTYDTGNPIPYSAASLRDGLKKVVATLDPDGKDPALHHMVLIGHSQGGLLTKLMVVDSGDRFWHNLTATPFAQADISPETRALAERTLFFKALTFVETVIFISTPHRGSFLASDFVSNLVRKLVRLPSSLTRVSMDLVRLQPIAALRSATSLPTSVDNMKPSSPFIRTLAESPIAPWVDTHSIIPVKGDGPIEDGDDGVVKYSSAHLDGVQSELVVRSGHSTQDQPASIEEVRRILYTKLPEDSLP